ncbi:unnamed protein product [Chrysoparadoxa australica]
MMPQEDGSFLPEEVSLHPASANSRTSDWSSSWLVYHELVHTSSVYISESTQVSPYALMLFGGALRVSPASSKVSMTHSSGQDWIRFTAMARIAALINRLRERLDVLLWEKIEDPEKDITGVKEVQALVELLKTDGMG